MSDLTGKRFNRLLVVEVWKISPERQKYWRCRCDCGGQVIARGSALAAGQYQSCGCWRRENSHRLAQARHVNGRFRAKD